MNYSEIYNDLIKIEKDCIRLQSYHPNRYQYYTSGFSNFLSYDKYCLLPFYIFEIAVSLRKLVKKLEDKEK